MVVWAASEVSPSITSDTSKEVPPRSAVTTFGKPAARAMAAAAMTPAAGPRQRRPHRQAPCGGGRHHAAVRLHDVEAAAKLSLRQRLGEPRQVGPDHRLEIGVEHRRRSALELPDLGQDLGRAGQVLVRPDRGCGSERRKLVRGVRVGVDEHDRQRFGALGEERPRRGPHLLRIDLGADLAAREGALADLESQVAIHDRGEIAPQTPGVAPVAPAHLDDVAKTPRRDQADAGALALEERIGADRRAVHDRGERRDLSSGAQPFQEPARLVAAMRRHLGGGEALAAFVEAEEVGEGAADVDADDRRRLPHASFRSRRAVGCSSTQSPAASTTS